MPIGSENLARRQDIEQAAALQLGLILFEFGRFELGLNLCIACSIGGDTLDALNEVAEKSTVIGKLEWIERSVEQRFPKGTEARAEWRRWLLQAHDIRQVRNRLAHGRWGIDVETGDALHVAGIPTSQRQHLTRYSASEMEHIRDTLEAIGGDLNALRDRWPI